MTRQIVLRHPSSMTRRRPLLLASTKSSSSSSLSKTFSSSSTANGRRSVGFGEVAGGTAAECAAVCCCCPCALVDFLVLTVYKLPAGLCRKALKQKRRSRLMKKGLLPQPSSRHCGCGCDDTELQIHPVAAISESMMAADKVLESVQPDEDVMQLEKEMWERFYGAGFWRSPSQKSNL
ncbi:uncharacterized protein LOC131318569 [Rhododendron vialii]|uniref:uncharacterized protein LOC131318569 n=1 Tax=Rhododendron vialii TaxID=182163 RepID=UPI00265FDA35|nr:uncharacterized protein LOC131318569 [Rhododendron vialii]